MAKPPFQVKATFDYKSQEADDLTFPNAQIITVTDVEDDDWYYGEYEDSTGKKQEGLFPKNFVKIYEPETPPRPSRANRASKVPEPAPIAAEAEEPRGSEEFEEPTPQPSTATAPRAAELKRPNPLEKPEEEAQPATIPPPAQSSIRAPPPAAPTTAAASKPAPPPTASKSPPPPVTEKPIGSFRDRINAFNKSTAGPPPAPAKPAGLGSGGGSSFVKKPFVAPPPSRSAYVPPPRQEAPHKVYRREEDPEVVGQASIAQDEEERAAHSSPMAQPEESEDQPKPTSLKERIALLQQQQMEQAAKHAEKKEKPKRTQKRQEVEQPPLEQEDVEGEELERIGSGDTTGKRSMETSREAPQTGVRPSTKPRKSREETPVGSPTGVPPRELFSDGNEADQSGAADTDEVEDLSTGRDDSDDKPRRQASMAHQQPPPAPSRESKHEEVAAADEEDEEEDDVDPEVKRRMEIRERMAKMSGGMGMAGMFGPPGAMPQPRAPTKQGTGSSERKMSGNSRHESAAEASRAPPVPIMPMPGLTKVKSPEQTEAPQPEVGREEVEEPKSIVQDRDPEDMPDVEDLKEEPVPTRSSTDRAVPPQPPQGKIFDVSAYDFGLPS